MFNKISFYGEQDISYVHTVNKIKTEENNIDNLAWTDNTIMLASFNGDLNASNYSGLVDSITGYAIFRQDNGVEKLKQVATVDSNTRKIVDYNIRSGLTMKYSIYPIVEQDGRSVFGGVLTTDMVSIDRYGWTLVGISNDKNLKEHSVTKSDVWYFWLNCETDSIEQNLSLTLENSLGKYPHATAGKTNYKSSSLSALIGDLDEGENYYEPRTAQEWGDFVASSKPKLLIDPYGNQFIVEIDKSTTSRNDKLVERPTTVSFHYTEIADGSEISVYLEEI